MLGFIIGNLCSLIAMGTDAISSWAKSAKKMLLAQTLSQFIYGIGAVVLKGYSAAVQNGISLVRNLLATRNRSMKYIEWILIALGVGLGLFFNNLGLLGLLPVVSNLQYSLAVLFFKHDEQKLKISFFINVFLFGIFNAAIWNLVGTASNILVCVMTMISIIKTAKQRRTSKVS